MSEPKFSEAWLVEQRRKEVVRAATGRLARAVKARMELNKAARSDGPTKRRGEAEHRAQVAVVTWATLARGQFPELALLFAIPNGGHRNVIVARKLKAEGVRAGVPDLMLPVARGGYHGLFVEMKAGKNRPSHEQLELMSRLVLEGFRCVVCYSGAEAEAVLREYLALSPTRVPTEPRGGADHE